MLSFNTVGANLALHGCLQELCCMGASLAILKVVHLH